MELCEQLESFLSRGVHMSYKPFSAVVVNKNYSPLAHNLDAYHSLQKKMFYS